jgi:hypothetical protein
MVLFFGVVSCRNSECQAETQRQATQHGCLPSLLGHEDNGIESPCIRNQLAGLSFFCIIHGSDYFHLGRGREITVAVQRERDAIV